MRPEQYPAFTLVHLKQDGTEPAKYEENMRFYFGTFPEVIEHLKTSENYHMAEQTLVMIELRRGRFVRHLFDSFRVTLRYNKHYWDAFLITGPIPDGAYLEYPVGGV